MSKEQLEQAALALPLAERVALAQQLWHSIEGDSAVTGSGDDHQSSAEAQRRDAELSAGTVAGRTHEQVMEAVRQAAECA
jgi:putative addiction module component (TIGR02574 family)